MDACKGKGITHNTVRFHSNDGLDTSPKQSLYKKEKKKTQPDEALMAYDCNQALEVLNAHTYAIPTN